MRQMAPSAFIFLTAKLPHDRVGLGEGTALVTLSGAVSPLHATVAITTAVAGAVGATQHIRP